MTKGSEHPEASRKKLVSEHLKNADRLLKSGEFDAALTEVEKSLELEPGNFYAQAYKERIAGLKEKHKQTGGPTVGKSPAAVSRSDQKEPAPPPRPQAAPEPETAADDQAVTENRDTIEGLEEQLARRRETDEVETQRHAEELARKALEEEIRQREEEARIRVREQEAHAGAAEAAKAEARSEFIMRGLRAARDLVASGEGDAAFRELARIQVIDPSRAELPGLRSEIDGLIEREMERMVPSSPGPARETVVALYSRILRIAWTEGVPNRKQQEILTAAKARLGITPDEGKGLLAGVQKEIFSSSMREAYEAGEPDHEQMEWLKRLAGELAVGNAEMEEMINSLRK